MSSRDPELRATRAAAGYRTQLRAVEKLVLEKDALIAELQDTLIRERVVTWLEDAEDFDLFIGRENVIVEGQVDFVLLEARIKDLLARKPGLAKVPRVTLNR